MQRYVARRLLQGVLTMLLVSIAIFAILRVAPGDVAVIIALQGEEEGEGRVVSAEKVKEIRARLGLDRPLPVQYIAWLGEVVTLDWGGSIFTDRSVWAAFTRKLPVTLELGLMTIVISLAISIPLGLISALRQDTWIDYVGRVFALGGLSIPNFWLATLLLVGGLYLLSWGPPLLYVSFFEDPVANLKQFIWPSLILGYSSAAVKSRMMRSAMLEVLHQDYIRTAHAKGLSANVVTIRHALKNALLPVVTVTGFTFALIVSGSVIIEQIFVLPGLGLYLVEGMRLRDYAVIQPLIVFFSFWIILINLAVDISYAWLDPRIRYT